MYTPLVSVIVPIYNVEKYLDQCIKSLVKQTYSNLEIILVDDGSEDASSTICDKFADQDKRIKVIHKLNGGPSSSREAGIAAITGEYAMFVDGDDWIDNDTIEVCLKYIDIYPELQCILFSYIKEYPGNSIPVQVMDSSGYFEGKKAKDKIYRRLFGLSPEEMNHPERMHNIESCCMKLYRTSFIKKGKFFDTKKVGSSEDALFNMYALYKIDKAYYIDKNFYHYRKLPQSLTNSYRPRLVTQWGLLFDTMEGIIKEKELEQEYTVALNNRIALSIFGIGINELGNSSVGVFGHIKNIQTYINSTRYVNAIEKLEITKMPVVWKVFMLSCKWKLSVCIYVILVVMTYLKKRA